MNILVLEPWYGGSHRNFVDGLIRHSEHTFHSVTMAARFWKWRMHGAAVTMAKKSIQALEDGFMPDLIFASNMVNLPGFSRLNEASVRRCPGRLYFLETC